MPLMSRSTKLQKLPAYKVNLQQPLAGASAYHDDEDIELVAVAWQDGVALQDLQYTEPPYKSLSRKLATELQNDLPYARVVLIKIDEVNNISRAIIRAADRY